MAWADTNAIIVMAPVIDSLDLMAVDAAADVIRIDRQAIEQAGVFSVPELLRQEANLYLRSHSSSSSDGEISMRGFGENSGVRVLVQVDGHAMNPADMAPFAWQQVPLSRVESVEVIRGGQNVLYGNHAIAGVVKITTKKGGVPEGTIRAEIGSFGYRHGSVEYGGGFGDQFFHVGVDSLEEDGFRDHSVSRSTSFNGSFGHYLNDTDTLTLRGAFSESDRQYPGALTATHYDEDPTQSIVTNDYNHTKSSLITGLWETDRIDGAGRVNAGFNMRNMDWAFGGTYAEQEMIGVSLGPRYRFGDASDFIMVGMDLKYDRVKHTRLYEGVYSFFDLSNADINRLSNASYCFVQRKFSNGFLLNGGVRVDVARTDYNYMEYVKGQLDPWDEGLHGGIQPNSEYKNPADITNAYDVVTKKLGWAAELSLAYEVSDAFSIFCGYDRVYRYPTLDEVASYQGYSLSEPVNEGLDPEEGNSVELGATFKQESWSVSVNTFYTRLDNEIGYSTNQNLNVNLGPTWRVGADVEVGYERTQYGFSSRCSFVNARIANGNSVPMVPWATGVFSVWYEPFEFIRLTASGSVVSDQVRGGDEENRLPRVDGYRLVSLRARWQISERCEYSFAVNNLFDKRYAAAVYGGAIYPGSGRSFQAGMSVRF